MLYNINKKIKLLDNRFRLIKTIVIAILLSSTLVALSACTLLTKPLDNRIGFSKHLEQVENNIRNEDWQQAKTNLEDSKESWKKLKPFIQVDIDHDYVKDIEDGFTKLDGYLATQDQSNSLVSILLIESTWENIDSL
ncbi:hypothetical protein P22_3603 [Propionispora sp. 2/2-37]|uniref:DUF4363 family protein n=1 Tax=Propionispora sp. 2/2-37 TaxID=1677858 RepID=UPI0006BB5D95|nr:DUF4363 family protein [Propionispora sp. 2/2-37]CUH97472.1 hypothetical protein P22_3603 [Propionispora sp. 2/2-37]